jgi:hypothetical protein
MLEKVLESVIALQNLSLSEEHSLLPAQHTGARPGGSIDTALDFLLQHIHTTGLNKDQVATLLSLDMTGAFDRVVTARLLHNMNERKIPEWIARWVGSFISTTTTTLCNLGYNIDTFPMHTGILQGTLRSPILFFFYNANLVDICNPRSLPTSGLGFLDDVKALACGKSTEENWKTLQDIHERCLDWARRHGATFAPGKYILVHFTKASPKHNFSCPLVLPASKLLLNPSARVLG